MNAETIVKDRQELKDRSGLQQLLLSSSARKMPYEIVDPQNILYASSRYFDKAWTGNFGKQRTPFIYESEVLSSIARDNDEVRKSAIEKVAQELLERFKLYNYDDDSEMLFWSEIDESITKTSMSIFGAALQSIIAKYNDYTNVLCAVAKCLCSFDLEQTAEWGPMVLIALLNHKNETVKEYAVFLLENWEDRNLLPILRNLDCHATWLREYIDSVVIGLEG